MADLSPAARVVAAGGRLVALRRRPVAITMLASSAIAIGLIVWSIVRFHGKPEARAWIDRVEADYRALVAQHERREAREETAEAREATEQARQADRRADLSERTARSEAP
ncbi:hypothetical protein [Serinicoccus sp. CUA-874]|uniref:hypothetical protein n=1 Tax=Serinicoccus sp. CUA-874 TaxID=1517939 RepID=UPI00192CE9C8|nr:hypothetical protein [Serinicoccus sp. CUA-874]